MQIKKRHISCGLCTTELAPSIGCDGYVCGKNKECGNTEYQIAYSGIVADEYEAMFGNGLIKLDVNRYVYDCESLSIDGVPVFEEEMKRWKDEH